MKRFLTVLAISFLALGGVAEAKETYYSTVNFKEAVHSQWNSFINDVDQKKCTGARCGDNTICVVSTFKSSPRVTYRQVPVIVDTTNDKVLYKYSPRERITNDGSKKDCWSTRDSKWNRTSMRQGWYRIRFANVQKNNVRITGRFHIESCFSTNGRCMPTK